MDPSPPLDADRLLEHAAWVRRLAGQLVRDPDAADDAAQDAFAAALKSGPREVSRAKAWFAAVVRSFVRRRARGDVRRARREQGAAQPERVSSAAEIVERAQASRFVVDAVLELPEPYRSTILMRWFDDVAPARIAEIRGEPVETVRTRLKRGHALLRERLSGLQALVLLAEPVHAAVTVTGGLVMTTLGKFAAAAVLAVVGVATWTLVPSHDATRDALATADAHSSVGSESVAPHPMTAVVAAEVASRDRTEPGDVSNEPAKSDAAAPAKDDSRWSDLTAENWQELVTVDDAQELHALVDGLDSESLDLGAFLRFVSGKLDDSFVVPGALERQTMSGSRSLLSWVAIYENANGERCPWLPNYSHDAKQKETAGMVLPNIPWSTERSRRLGLPENTNVQAALIFMHETGKTRGFFNLTIWPMSTTVAEMQGHEAELKRLADDHRLPSRLDFEFAADGGRLTWQRSGSTRALSATEAAQLAALFESIRATGQRLEKEK